MLKFRKIQEKVSTGKNILAASDDPVNAVSLSVANEQKDLLQRYTQNADDQPDASTILSRRKYSRGRQIHFDSE